MKRTLCAALAARDIARFGADILPAQGMIAERLIRQHGATSVFRHSLYVAFVSLYWAKRLGLCVDARALVRGALLHDYFLYDWHRPGHGRLHGFRHPSVALANAQREFALSPVEEDVIARHMFPLNLTPPKYKESWLVCGADKLCAVRETLRLRAGCEELLHTLDENACKSK